MRCPTCDVDLQMSERQGIEIDYCPKCRGVWLDRGELDKIIERTSAEYGPARGRDEARRDEPRRDEPRREYHDERRSDHYDKHDHKRKKKPSSFLGEIFDL